MRGEKRQPVGNNFISYPAFNQGVARILVLLVPSAKHGCIVYIIILKGA